MAEPSAPDLDREQRMRAIGTLIWKDPERILDAVSRLRGSEAIIECRLRGGSMEPAIPRGSTLRIDLGRTAPYRVGEVVAFVQDSGICVHRVAYLGRGQSVNNYLITQGDACFYPDPPVDVMHVLGPVTEFRYQEHWQATAAQPTGDRAQSLIGRVLLKLVASLMEVHVRLGQSFARALRIRKESVASAEV